MRVLHLLLAHEPSIGKGLLPFPAIEKELLPPHEREPSIGRWLAELRSAEERYAVAEGNDADVCRRVVELTSERGTPRRTLARLSEERGLRVLRQLWDRRDDPAIAALLGLPLRRGRGRPEGSRTRDAVAYALATIVDDLRVAPVKLLPALGRGAFSDSPDHPWLSACRKRGDELRAGAPSRDPELPLLVFWRWYYKDDPPKLLKSLRPYLVRAYSGVEQRGEAEAKLQAALEALLPR